MLSPVSASVQYEIWLYARPHFRLAVQDCGLFGSEDAACRVGAAVRMWLQTNVWSEGVLGPVLDRVPDPIDPHSERVGVLLLPQILREQGVDPARTLVTVRRYGEGRDSECPDPADEPTVLEPPDTFYSALGGTDPDDVPLDPEGD